MRKIPLIALSTCLVTIAPTFPQNFSMFFSVPQVSAQTPKNQNFNQNSVVKSPVSGNFIDYFAEERQLKGHEGSVNSANFSPDGKRIVTAGTDKSTRVWDLSGKLLIELRGHSGSVRSANFSPDNKLIVTTSGQIWDTTGKLLVELRGHQDAVNSASFSPDGKLIIIPASDKNAQLSYKTARVLNNSGKLLFELKGHRGSPNSASFSPDGKLIVTVTNVASGALNGNMKVFDTFVQVWDRNGLLLAEFQNDKDVSLSPNPNLFNGFDTMCNMVRLGLQPIGALFRTEVSRVSVSPDSKLIVAPLGRSARVWDTNGKLLAELKGHGEKFPNADETAL